MAEMLIKHNYTVPCLTVLYQALKFHKVATVWANKVHFTPQLYFMANKVVLPFDPPTQNFKNLM